MRQFAVICLLALSACGSVDAQVATDERNNVPEEFREACGKPGAEVLTERAQVVVKHADCDLTGVVIKNQSGGVTVPARGVGAAGSGEGGTITIEVDRATGDVTFTAGL
jgi:hypothetical protein